MLANLRVLAVLIDCTHKEWVCAAVIRVLAWLIDELGVIVSFGLEVTRVVEEPRLEEIRESLVV